MNGGEALALGRFDKADASEGDVLLLFLAERNPIPGQMDCRSVVNSSMGMATMMDDGEMATDNGSMRKAAVSLVGLPRLGIPQPHVMGGKRDPDLLRL